MKQIYLLVICVFSSLSYADTFPKAEYDHQFHWILSFGLQNGGDPLQEVVRVNDGVVIEKLRAGGFSSMHVGGILPLGQSSDFSLQFTGGYLYDEISSNINEDKAWFRRSTAELIPFYNFGRQRVGLGLAAHFSPTFVEKTVEGDFRAEFDDALGAVLQYDVMYSQSLSFGFRAEYIEYKISNEVIQAPSIGIQANFLF